MTATEGEGGREAPQPAAWVLCRRANMGRELVAVNTELLTSVVFHVEHPQREGQPDRLVLALNMVGGDGLLVQQPTAAGTLDLAAVLLGVGPAGAQAMADQLGLTPTPDPALACLAHACGHPLGAHARRGDDVLGGSCMADGCRCRGFVI